MEGRICDGRLAKFLIVRLSSGISANILDFSLPQKHVLKAMPVANQPARMVALKSKLDWATRMRGGLRRENAPVV